MSFLPPPEDSQILLLAVKVKKCAKFLYLRASRAGRGYGFTPDLRRIVIIGHQFVKAD